MEVSLPIQTPATPAEFNFDSSCSTPYLTAPSSPLPFGRSAATTNSSSSFFSAPTSPGASSPTSQFHEFDFNFDFACQLSAGSSFSAADELFRGGRILPLGGGGGPPPPPASSSLEIGDFRDSDFHLGDESEDRGREWRMFTSCSSYNFDSDGDRNRGRSLSPPPMRIADVIHDDGDEDGGAGEIGRKATTTKLSSSLAAAIASAMSLGGSGGRYKKWKIRDFLLFRSKSEGRATSDEQLIAAKYAVLSRRESLQPPPVAAAAEGGGGKGSSFRSTESFGSSRPLRPAAVSAHEMHYTMKRAAAEEMRRKTYLPYKQGLLGCLGFNPAGQDISRGIGSLTRG